MINLIKGIVLLLSICFIFSTCNEENKIVWQGKKDAATMQSLGFPAQQKPTLIASTVRNTSQNELDAQSTLNEITTDEVDEDAVCEYYIVTKKQNAPRYKICRTFNPRGEEFYYFPDIRGDIWFVGAKTPTFFSIGNTQNINNVALWRSSYKQLAPHFNNFGIPLYEGCPNCVRGGNYQEYTLLAKHLDDGLFYLESGNWDYARARIHFSEPHLLNYCEPSHLLTQMLHGLKNTASNLLVDTVYNILDEINFLRYGCPRTNLVHVCYGKPY